jgi:hypothetical protein
MLLAIAQVERSAASLRRAARKAVAAGARYQIEDAGEAV